MRFRDFQRINGSHHIYRHIDVPRPLSIQPIGNMAKPYQIDQFLVTCSPKTPPF